MAPLQVGSGGLVVTGRAPQVRDMLLTLPSSMPKLALAQERDEEGPSSAREKGGSAPAEVNRAKAKASAVRACSSQPPARPKILPLPLEPVASSQPAVRCPPSTIISASEFSACYLRCIGRNGLHSG